jgi:hypothetical protein
MEREYFRFGFSGLFTKKGIRYTIIEKKLRMLHPKCNHYERLHLHTDKVCQTCPIRNLTKQYPVIPHANR